VPLMIFYRVTNRLYPHIVHDEIVIDLCNEERHLVPEIRDIFSKNQLGTYKVNLNAGTNYLELEELRL
jgi:hypothetical protein